LYTSAARGERFDPGRNRRVVFVINAAGEIDMSDDKSKTGRRDRDRINVNEDYELKDWSKKFGVTPEELKTAVQSVGTSREG
jgi:uncharacterized protein DUF3606